MREAQKLMQDPAFQAQMKKMTENPQFKAHMEKTKEVLKDPKKVKEMEAKMKVALEEGNKTLEEVEKKRAELKGKDGEEGAKEEGDEDKKQAAKTEDDEDDIPDIPSLNLN